MTAKAEASAYRGGVEEHEALARQVAGGGEGGAVVGDGERGGAALGRQRRAAALGARGVDEHQLRRRCLQGARFMFCCHTVQSTGHALNIVAMGVHSAV